MQITFHDLADDTADAMVLTGDEMIHWIVTDIRPWSDRTGGTPTARWEKTCDNLVDAIQAGDKPAIGALAARLGIRVTRIEN